MDERNAPAIPKGCSKELTLPLHAGDVKRIVK